MLLLRLTPPLCAMLARIRGVVTIPLTTPGRLEYELPDDEIELRWLVVPEQEPAVLLKRAGLGTTIEGHPQSGDGYVISIPAQWDSEVRGRIEEHSLPSDVRSTSCMVDEYGISGRLILCRQAGRLFHQLTSHLYWGDFMPKDVVPTE